MLWLLAWVSLKSSKVIEIIPRIWQHYTIILLVRGMIWTWMTLVLFGHALKGAAFLNSFSALTWELTISEEKLIIGRFLYIFEHKELEFFHFFATILRAKIRIRIIWKKILVQKTRFYETELRGFWKWVKLKETHANTRSFLFYLCEAGWLLGLFAISLQ